MGSAMQVSMEFKLPARIRKKGRWFISSCEPLDVHSQGHTRDEAERNLSDALASFLISCYERGTLDAVLRASGFVPATGRPKARRSARRVKTVTVPVPFSVEHTRARASA
jgi:predicted RNase H-like HicB family nuclease